MKNKKTNNRIAKEKEKIAIFTLFLLLLNLLITLSIFSISSTQGIAAPEGPLNLTELGTSTRTPTSASTLEAYAGNITRLNIIANTVTQSWQGYYGNISGTITLDDSKNNTLYDWSLADPEGEIYASTSAIDFSDGNIGCFNYSPNVPPAYLSLTELETSLGLESDDADGINETFSNSSTHTSFYSGTNLIDGSTSSISCPSVNLYNSTAQSTTGLFEEVLLYDETNHQIIYTAIIEQDEEGFTNETIDFQMIVGENGHEGNTDTTTYYFYVELE